ncbi:Uncharacterized protein Rs2_15952 [Raphanus sativus]|nr:Uncharacterized protein Rs2_15952 [Raphanus sativus]
MKEKFKRELDYRDVTTCGECRLARRSLVRGYDVVLDAVRAKFQKWKEEKDAEIHLQEVRARIKALTGYNEGGFELEEEVSFLKRPEISLEVDFGAASVSDTSLRRLDIPQVSDDLINQDRADD